MENELCKKKTTTPDTSVGADDGQPLHNSTENSISAFDEEINGDFQNNSESLLVVKTCVTHQNVRNTLLQLGSGF